MWQAPVYKHRQFKFKLLLHWSVTKNRCTVHNKRFMTQIHVLMWICYKIEAATKHYSAEIIFKSICKESQEICHTQRHNMVSGCVDLFLLETFSDYWMGQWVYQLLYNFERFADTEVLSSFHGMRPLVQCLEVPSYSSEKLTSPEDNFECSTRIQTSLQLATRMNSCLSTFVLPLDVTCIQSTRRCGICFFSANSGIKLDSSINV